MLYVSLIECKVSFGLSSLDSKGGAVAQSGEGDSWSGGPWFDSRCGRPLPTGWVGVSIM